MLAGWIAVPGECLVECVLTQNPCGSPDKVIFLFILPRAVQLSIVATTTVTITIRFYLPDNACIHFLKDPLLATSAVSHSPHTFFDIGSWIQILAGLTLT